MSDFHILVVEDDRVLNEQLATLLMDKGYQVERCYSGEEGLIRAISGEHHLILLDVMLPDRDGFSLLNLLRKTSQTPVIMVTAKDAEQERIQGFSQGADDYVSKPFSPVELLLRIEALLRRSHHQSSDRNEKSLSIDDLVINYENKTVSVKGTSLDFTPIQLKLLWELLLHKGETLTKAYLYQRVLNRNISAYDRSLDMHLSRIRRKLNEAGWAGERLQTSHGKGYFFI